MFLSALVAAILVAACAPQPSYRYELTVEIDTPEGLRKGSSVLEVHAQKEFRLLPNFQGQSVLAEGEAVTVLLPKGEKLFALLGGDARGRGTAETIPLAMLTDEERKTIPFVEVGGVLSAQKRQAVLRPEDYPQFVRFSDLSDPGTIEQINPADVAKLYGSGYAIRRIIAKTTSAPVSRRLERHLIWLPRRKSPITRAIPNGQLIFEPISSFKR
ncbi:hypothetical protein E2493_20030 [Sphingomonas parva]|uniref:Uncharacterized protein n=1 Tax=Sphingomonas parva TaxID=2555898 RepID=A0A4Y8ZMI7_9SPHN|nr:hypothetical protein [Sphingomonas parva]TFI56472.1 hypothetical protein E2493_20030 [Sphingomonas parva]